MLICHNFPFPCSSRGQLVLTRHRKEDRTPARYSLLDTCCGMPTLRPSKLYQNCLKLQSASCASTGRLENPGRVHCGRDDNCSILCAVPFYELEDEIDEATHIAISCPMVSI
jgi:hypothetical protein